jgi:hypothetical protein
MDRHPFLVVVGAEAVTLAVLIAGWNAWCYREQIRNRVRAVVRA